MPVPENNLAPWYKTGWGRFLLAFLFLLLVFLAVFAFLVLDEVKQLKNSRRHLSLRSLPHYQADSASSFWFGTTSPQITIVEFGDFTCPSCRRAYPTIRRLGLEYKDKIKIIWRDYPVISKNSLDLAQAARCAGEQGLFWPMYDKLFQNQGLFSSSTVDALARQIGVNEKRYLACRRQKKYLKAIEKDIVAGQSFQIKGTPAWFINGYKVEGNIPYPTFKEIIQDLLNSPAILNKN